MVLLDGDHPDIETSFERDRDLGELHGQRRILSEAVRIQEKRVEMALAAAPQRIAKEYRYKCVSIMEDAAKAWAGIPRPDMGPKPLLL